MQKLKLSGWWVLLAVPLLALLFWQHSLTHPAAPVEAAATPAVAHAGFLSGPPQAALPATPVPPTLTPAPADLAHAALFAHPARISSEFGHYPNSTMAHYGLDLAVDRNTEVFAPVAGTVLAVVRGCAEGDKYCGSSPEDQWGSGFGNHLWFVSAETGHYIVLAHFTSVDEWVKAGVTFPAGKRLGLSGTTGNSTGPHVHVQVNPAHQMGNDGSTNAAWEFPWLSCGNPDGKLNEYFGGHCDEVGAIAPTAPVATTCADYANPRCGKLDGTAAYYDRGVMQQVLRNRGITPRADVNGYAAVTDCSLIGKVAVAEIMGGAPERFLIADCSATQDLATQISRRQVIEVDWETAVRHGLNKVGRGPATLLRIEG